MKKKRKKILFIGASSLSGSLVEILGEFLSGPRVAKGTRGQEGGRGTWVTFRGVKFN